MSARASGGRRFVVEEHLSDAACIVRVRGEVDVANARELRDALSAAAMTKAALVAVDLCGATFMDSTGLSALLNANRRLARSGRRLALVCAEGPVLKLMELTRLVGTLAVHPTLEAALAS